MLYIIAMSVTSSGRVDFTFFKGAAIFLLICFCASLNIPYAFSEVNSLPGPPQILSAGIAYDPPCLRGLKTYPDDPLKFDFIIARGGENLSPDALKEESRLLIRYFLSGLAIPDNDFWVNLSPYEHDRMITDELGMTDMGAGMLSQDYVLKQMASSLTFPDSPLGKKFWDKAYAKAREAFGANNIPLNTFNKIWIVPQRAVIYQDSEKVIIGEARLKVMMEEDYAALSAKGEGRGVNKVSSSVMKEVVLPQIEKEVNEGKNFAELRQIYHSLILAVWFKQKLRENILHKNYVDKKKTKGVDIDDPQFKEKVYSRYIEAYRKGAYNLIKKDVESGSNKRVYRRYFSGGLGLNGIANMWQTSAMAAYDTRDLNDTIIMTIKCGFISGVASAMDEVNILTAEDSADLTSAGIVELMYGSEIMPGGYDELLDIIGPALDEARVPVKETLLAPEDGEDPDFALADRAVNILPASRERDILGYIFGVDNKKKKTQEKISKIFHITVTRVQQIRDRVLRKLRRHKDSLFILPADVANDLGLLKGKVGRVSGIKPSLPELEISQHDLISFVSHQRLRNFFIDDNPLQAGAEFVLRTDPKYDRKYYDPVSQNISAVVSRGLFADTAMFHVEDFLNTLIYSNDALADKFTVRFTLSARELGYNRWGVSFARFMPGSLLYLHPYITRLSAEDIKGIISRAYAARNNKQALISLHGFFNGRNKNNYHKIRANPMEQNGGIDFNSASAMVETRGKGPMAMPDPDFSDIDCEGITFSIIDMRDMRDPQKYLTSVD